MIVIMFVVAQQAQKRAKLWKKNGSRLLIASLVGSAGITVGGLLAAFSIWKLGGLFEPVRCEWGNIWRGVAANSNAWVGDSSTLAAVIAILEKQQADSAAVHFAGPVFLLDSLLGILWFMTLTANRGNAAPPALESSTDASSRRPIFVFGGIALIASLIIHLPAWQKEELVLVFFAAFFGTGFLAYFLAWVNHPRERGSSLLSLAGRFPGTYSPKSAALEKPDHYSWPLSWH
jgi:hypothetical protein